jgi:hypothetical protein
VRLPVTAALCDRTGDLGALLALFMERPAGLVAAGSCWGLAALLMNASRVARWLAQRRHS